MNHFLKIFIFLSATVALFSCSDDFVNDKLTISGVATSAIIISPEWEADDYQFKCEGVANADFTISSQPEWLSLDSRSGKFTDSIATVHGSVRTEPRFSETGFYVDQMIINTGGKQFAVPVYYITEGNPVAQVNRSLEIAYSNYNNVLQITNTGEGILLWDVVSFPDWLTINMDQFNPQTLILGKGSSANLPFLFNVNAAVKSDLKGTIVLKTNDKNNPTIEVAVTASLGTPDVYTFYENMDFGSSETTKRVQLSNFGSGILVWNLEGLPDWLSVSPSSGIAMPYSGSGDLTFTCNRASLQPGLTSATFYLKTNDPDEASVAINVKVRVPGLSANIKTLEGNIVDVVFDKSTNTLYYATSQPNKLVAYDVTNRAVLHEVSLSKAPTSLSISEDFKQALLGHGGSISKVDLSSFQVDKTYTLNTTVYDVEWATNGWFCYTNENSTSNLLWINSNTGATYQTPNTLNTYSLGTADLKKIDHQPYLIASGTDGTPSGIYVFDLNTKAMKSYTHSSVGNFWFFKQGELMATGASSITSTSMLTDVTGNQINNPEAMGVLKPGQYSYISWWIDYSEVKHSYWALFSYYLFTYYPPVKGTFYQFEDNDYTLVKTYTYDYMFQPNANVAAYEVEARYLFANGSGTELSVLRKAVDNNTWSIEFMPIP